MAELDRRLRCLVAILGKPCEAGALRGYQRHLRHGEEAVQENEKKKEKKDFHGFWLSARTVSAFWAKYTYFIIRYKPLIIKKGFRLGQGRASGA